MALTEKVIKDRERLDDRDLPKTETTGYVDVVEDVDIYLISAETMEMAILDARTMGIRRNQMVYVPMAQPLRSRALMGRRGLRKDQLIGYFSDMEFDYLTS